VREVSSEKTYRVHFGDLRIDGRVLLKRLQKLVVKEWNGVSWLTYV